jgi:hypothetical protein
VNDREHTPIGEEELARVRRELAALGEDDLTEDELRADTPKVESADDVAFFDRLQEVSAPIEGALGQLAHERVWRKVDAASGGPGSARPSIGRAAWVRALFAVAAVLALIWMLPLGPSFGPTGSDPGIAAGGEPRASAAMADSARAGLQAIGVDRSRGADAARTRSLIAGVEGRHG